MVLREFGLQFRSAVRVAIKEVSAESIVLRQTSKTR